MKLPVVITAAGPAHRHLLHQTLVTPAHERLPIARFFLDLVEPCAQRVAFIVSPGTAPSLAAELPSSVHLIQQSEPRGYAHALYQARDFTAGEPFLHLVGDHFYLPDAHAPQNLIQTLVQLYETEHTSISAVQPTRESLLHSFGAVAGPAHSSSVAAKLYQVETVLEKPTPTLAEQELISPGLRAGHYLCFFGLHLFTPALMTVLGEYFTAGRAPASLGEALQTLARRERYLAAILPGRRFDLGSPYGLLQAQLALSLQSPDREEILTLLVELLARENH
jgi:UTP--glucose-1-phosphate uridylyltransferase